MQKNDSVPFLPLPSRNLVEMSTEQRPSLDFGHILGQIRDLWKVAGMLTRLPGTDSRIPAPPFLSQIAIAHRLRMVMNTSVHGVAELPRFCSTIFRAHGPRTREETATSLSEFNLRAPPG